MSLAKWAKSINKIDAILWLIIALATVFRLGYTFYDNPMDNMILSDPRRHFLHGMNMGCESNSYMDPIGYQLWLSILFKTIGTTRFKIGCYAGLLSAVTPWLWYQWLRLALPSKRAAVIGYAILVTSASWIGIFALFMMESLLLPMLGLSLWLTWVAKEKQKASFYILAATAWACTIATRMTVIPPMVVPLVWLGKDLFAAGKNKKAALLITAACTTLLTAAALTIPIYTYIGLGDFWLCPPGWLRQNHIYCESGAKNFTSIILYKDGHKEVKGPWENPNVWDNEPLGPFFKWRDPRTGHIDIVVDCHEKPQLFAPGLTMSLSNWGDLYVENFIIFFLTKSWPDCNPWDWVHCIEVSTRWIWLPLTLLAVILIVRTKKLSVIEMMFLIMTASHLLQNMTVMEGRYRKPWEGLLVAALLSLILQARSWRTPRKSEAD